MNNNSDNLTSKNTSEGFSSFTTHLHPHHPIIPESKWIVQVVAASIPVERIPAMKHDGIVNGFFHVQSNAVIIVQISMK